MSEPVRVCFVCTGNICRSPMAEAILRSHVEAAGLTADVVVDSAGTGSWHVGGGADRRAIATLRRHGYDLSHTAQQFRPAWFNDRDLVIALDESHLDELTAAQPRGSRADVRLLRSFDPHADGDLDVPDPYYGSGDGFERTLDLIEAAMPGLMAEIRSRLAVRP